MELYTRVTYTLGQVFYDEEFCDCVRLILGVRSVTEIGMGQGSRVKGIYARAAAIPCLPLALPLGLRKEGFCSKK